MIFAKYFADKFLSFADFVEKTGGVLYLITPSGQIEMLFINTDSDLYEYTDYIIDFVDTKSGSTKIYIKE